MLHDGLKTLPRRLQVLTRQCSHIMVTQVRALESAVKADTTLLTPAVRSVFADFPDRANWVPSRRHVGRYVAHVPGQVYSVNLLSGCVLCNGITPGHLPQKFVQHAVFCRVFGHATFEVAQLRGEQQGMFRTVQSHGGCVYTFHIKGNELVVAECPDGPGSPVPMSWSYQVRMARV